MTFFPSDSAACVLVTGASGRIGRMLRALWRDNRAGNLPVLWHGRRAGPGVDLVWDIGAEPAPGLPRGMIILHLAGRTTGSASELDDNRRATGALCRAARASAAAHVLVMSSAAVYPPGPLPIAETTRPAPVSPYGQAKLAAEQAATRLGGPGLTVLRLANLAGADALLGNVRADIPSVLDPVEGQPGGPERSYIGPLVLARVLQSLLTRVASGHVLPDVINLAQPGVIAMADLLNARGQRWSFGPVRAGVVARVALDTALLQGLMPVPMATPAGLIADLDALGAPP